ncbi:MAG: hypothetical protein ACOYVK_17380 [Bacillota bacterium]
MMFDHNIFEVYIVEKECSIAALCVALGVPDSIDQYLESLTGRLRYNELLGLIQNQKIIL